MLFFTALKDFIDYRDSFVSQSKIGFVPTMGALHKGHISLYQKSIKDNDITIASIFINPTQFNNKKDFENYPVSLEKDKEILTEIGVDVLFYPEKKAIYPLGEELDAIDLGSIEKQMEGAFRPGHFAGVATVVNRLFKIVKPHNAYFGEKDYQQLQIIKRMVEIEKHSVNIIGMPILREKNGLAMSSRNLRLSEKEKTESTIIYKTLKEVQKKFEEESISDINKYVKETFQNSNLKLEYFIIADTQNLETAIAKDPLKKYRAFIAAYSNKIRLIDNIEMY